MGPPILDTNKRQRRKRNRTIRTFKTGSGCAGAGACLVLVLVLVLCRRRCCCGKKVRVGSGVESFCVAAPLCGWAKGLRRLLARGCLEISAWEVKAFGCAWLRKGVGAAVTA